MRGARWCSAPHLCHSTRPFSIPYSLRQATNDIGNPGRRCCGLRTRFGPDFGSTAARNRLVIALLLVSTFVVFLNETIMSVAIQPLMTDLGVTASAAQWLTTAFLLTMAVVIPITGFLLQRINTRPIFMLAMSIFSVGTLICAVSPGLELLVVRSRHPGHRHGDHDAAADDHGDDPGAAQSRAARPWATSRSSCRWPRPSARPSAASSSRISSGASCSSWCCRSRSARWRWAPGGCRTSRRRARPRSTSSR